MRRPKRSLAKKFDYVLTDKTDYLLPLKMPRATRMTVYDNVYTSMYTTVHRLVNVRVLRRLHDELNPKFRFDSEACNIVEDLIYG